MLVKHILIWEKYMMLSEFKHGLKNEFKMSIEETYASFDLDENTNIFIESFDGINFEIIKMNRITLDMETIEEISVKTEKELNKKISKIVNNIYDFAI